MDGVVEVITDLGWQRSGEPVSGLVVVRRGAEAAEKADTPVFKRDVCRRFTHLGRADFVSRYCRDAGATLGSGAIRRQMRKHMRRVAALFNDPDLI